MTTTSTLNIKVADLFSDAPEVENDFVAPNQALPNDFVDESQSDLQRNEQSKQELRDGWAERIDWDVAHGTQHGRDNDNPAQQTAPYGMQVAASNTAPKESVLGTVLVQGDSVVKGRVAAQGIQGTVIADGNNEFSVIWDDKVASTEEKSNYRLINKR
jgi:hypothetical protein